MRWHPGRKPVLGAVALLAALSAMLSFAPAAYAGGGQIPSKYVFKEQGQSVLVVYDTLATDGCTATEVAINASAVIIRTLPAPSETFGPGAFAFVTQWNQCDPNQLPLFYAGETFGVSLNVAKTLSGATLTASIPVYLNGDETQPAAFNVTTTNLTLTATQRAIHTIQNFQFHNPVSNYVAHTSGYLAPASAAGVVTLGPLGSVSGADLTHGEIDSIRAGSTTVTRS